VIVLAHEFYLEIITPERKFFQGEVEMVVVPGLDGELGILRGHVPMVTALDVGMVRIKQNNEWKEAAVSEGFMEVRPDETIILAQAAEWPEEIDVNRALAAKERAEERLRQRRSMKEYVQSKTSLARALTRLRIKNRNVRID